MIVDTIRFEYWIYGLTRDNSISIYLSIYLSINQSIYLHYTYIYIYCILYIYQETVDLPRPPSAQNHEPSTKLSQPAPVATAQQSQHASARCLELWVVAMKRNGLDGGERNGQPMGSLVTSTPPGITSSWPSPCDEWMFFWGVMQNDGHDKWGNMMKWWGLSGDIMGKYDYQWT